MPPSSGPKIEPTINKQQTEQTIYLLRLLIHPEDGGSIFRRNVGELLPDCTVSY
jgi:hypothetical protein